jgi:hypothetical protein
LRETRAAEGKLLSEIDARERLYSFFARNERKCAGARQILLLFQKEEG